MTPIEPFRTGMLTLRDSARIYWETSGNLDGVPLVWLHGGPGTGLMSGGYRDLPDPKDWLIVGLDQRGCGRSRPLANAPGFDLASLQTPELIADLEELRQYLGIERWLVAGGSWGTTLALAYGEAHPSRVIGFALASVTDGSREYVDWISKDVGRVFPEAWRAFEAASGRSPGQSLPEAYVDLLTSADEEVRRHAASAWCAWEDAHMSIPAGPRHLLGDRDPTFREVYALQVAYSWAHQAFLGEHGIQDHLDRITHLPAVLIHGRLDVSGPLVTAWELHKNWPGSRLVVIEDEGHGGPRMSAALGQALRELHARAASVRP